MNTPVEIPEGWMQDAKGRLVPPGQISELDRLGDKLVRELMDRAIVLSAELWAFKHRAFGDLTSFYEISAEHYGAKHRARKGNVTFYSFDRKYKVERRFADNIRFNELLQVAKDLIDECLTDWTLDGRDEVRVLMQDAFRVDSEGTVNAARVFSLRRFAFEDERWHRAMKAIDDSVIVVGTASYIRFYERVGETDQYRQILLDFSAVGRPAA
jgi:hypothetical protein